MLASSRLLNIEDVLYDYKVFVMLLKPSHSLPQIPAVLNGLYYSAQIAKEKILDLESIHMTSSTNRTAIFYG
ncbi:hypothetical protein KCP78_03285 [Salmonella enterica subsp. enterica]|nr:hypothetical protein KCP78_03285 [Salmonella enterica subsp. enterica]